MDGLVRIALHDAAGRIVMTTDVPDEATATRLAGDLGLTWLAGPPADDGWFVVDDTFAEIPARPDQRYEFDWTSKAWVLRPLEQLKGAAWDRIKLARAGALAAGVVVEGLGHFDADPTAVLNITGVMAGLAFLPADWSISWTRFDNTAIVLTKESFPIVALAVLAHGDAVHQTARALRGQINAAADADALALIDWPA